VKYLWTNFYADHWADIAKMLDDNYAKNIDDASIIVGSYFKHSIDEFKPLVGNKRIIIYQLEPLIDSNMHFVENIVNNLKIADEVWDYDLDNIKMLKQYGINAKHKPCLYSKSLEKIKNSTNPDIDVLFYGTMFPRRINFIHDAFYNSYMSHFDTVLKSSFVYAHGVWGDNLDKYIARSKIILNLNPSDAESRQQQTRIFYALTNSKCVISERSNKNYFNNLIREFSTPKEMIDLIGELLINDNWKLHSNNNSFKQHTNLLLQNIGAI